MQTIFTVGQVAKICKVAPRTVNKWFDSGRLRGYRIPGSQDRRIPREHLIRFLKEHGMSLEGLEDEVVGKILFVGLDANMRTELIDRLPSEGYKTESAASGFEAGIYAENQHPDCVVIDFGMGRHEAGLIGKNLRVNTDYAGVILIAILRKEDPGAPDPDVFNEVCRQPFEIQFLAERIQTLIGQKK